MPQDIAQWGFLLLVIMIAGPILFYLIFLFVYWVKWLANKEDRAKDAFANLFEIKIKDNGTLPFRYELGEDSTIQINILNTQFNLVFEVFNGKKEKGLHETSFETTILQKGTYYCQLVTENQKLTKKFEI